MSKFSKEKGYLRRLMSIGFHLLPKSPYQGGFRGISSAVNSLRIVLAANESVKMGKVIKL
jgi:hypothetical protein